MSYSRGLLVLFDMTAKRIGPLLTQVKHSVKDKLFLSVFHENQSLNSWKEAVSTLYNTASRLCPSLDVCLLLPGASRRGHSIDFDVLFSEPEHAEEVCQHARCLNASFRGEPICLQSLPHAFPDTSISATIEQYDNVCLGGTFDHLHNGHKILLSVGAFLAREELLVGVTADSILQHKKLAPLIYSHAGRCDAVRSFLRDIGFPLSKLNLVSLVDAFGPPAYSPNYQCIISSAESSSNCIKLNDARTSKGMAALHVEQIEFALSHSDHRSVVPEDLLEPKLSSSEQRFELLGKLLRPVNTHANVLRGTRNLYVIGLIGPSGAGKSSLANRLEKLSPSVHVINCDKLGHDAYLPGTPCYNKLIEFFGREAILSAEPPYTIDRGRLGKLVFSNAEKLTQLNNLVWPEIKKSICDLLSKLDSSINHRSTQIAVLDAAVLLLAGWDTLCEEIWLATIPKEEAIRRFTERSGLDPQDARVRLDQQASNIANVTGGLDWWDVGQLDTGRGPISRAHVVLSTLWEPECSQMQVEKAFRLLQQRLPCSK